MPEPTIFVILRIACWIMAGGFVGLFLWTVAPDLGELTQDRFKADPGAE